MQTEPLQKLAEDPTLFAKLLLNFTPFPYQQKLLNDKSKRIVACMGRQTGKTTTISNSLYRFLLSQMRILQFVIARSI